MCSVTKVHTIYLNRKKVHEYYSKKKKKHKPSRTPHKKPKESLFKKKTNRIKQTPHKLRAAAVNTFPKTSNDREKLSAEKKNT